MDFDYVRNIQRKEKDLSRITDIEKDYYAKLADFVRKSTDEYKRNQDPNQLRNLENIMKLARDIFDQREQKFVMKALRASRTGELDETNMTEEEKGFYHALVNILKQNRKFFDKVMLGDYTYTQELNAKEETKNNSIVLVRILKSIPRYVGADSNEYGPFKPSEIIKLPRKEAEFLSHQNLVELM